MALNTLFLKNALYNALAANPCITDLICVGEIDPLYGQPVKSIFESEPNFVEVTPAVTYTILDVNPLTRDDPTNGHFIALVLFYGIGDTQEQANIIGDQLQSMLTDRPAGESRKWFFDITDACVVNKFTKFISRLRSGRQGISRNNPDTENYADVIEAEFIWHNCNCSNERCDDVTPQICPVATEDDYTNLDCNC